MSSSSAKISLEDYINSFLWDKRIVLLISKENQINIIGETDNFFASNGCENESRNFALTKNVLGELLFKSRLREKKNNSKNNK